jgi:hypothetical protein
MCKRKLNCKSGLKKMKEATSNQKTTVRLIAIIMMENIFCLTLSSPQKFTNNSHETAFAII